MRRRINGTFRIQAYPSSSILAPGTARYRAGSCITDSLDPLRISGNDRHGEFCKFSYSLFDS
jgi:hypothetical protein